MREAKSSLFWIVAAFAFLLPGCGPNMTLVRQYMDASPHHRVAVMPMDRAPGQRDLSLHAADMMETKMRRTYFDVISRQMVRRVYNQSPIKGHLYDDPLAAAELGRTLGVQAVLIGSIDEAYERLSKKPPTYRVMVRTAGFAVRVRLIDVASGNVIWEASQVDRPLGVTVYKAADEVTDALANKLIEDFMRQNL